MQDEVRVDKFETERQLAQTGLGSREREHQDHEVPEREREPKSCRCGQLRSGMVYSLGTGAGQIGTGMGVLNKDTSTETPVTTVEVRETNV